MKTLAAIMYEPNKDLFIEELEIPKLNYGQVLVKINFSGMCGTQLSEIAGLKGEDKWLPHCLGHEGTGQVVEIGEGVSKVKKDEKVILSWIKGDGIDAGGTTYKIGEKAVNAGPVTTFQHYTVVSENRLSLQPKELDDVTAVLLGCAAPTGMGGVFNIIKLNNTSKIIIFGAGGVGLCACLACKSSKPKDITFIEPNKTRRDLAVKFGATKTIDPKSKNFLELFNKELCENFDYAIEASGQLNCFEKSTKVIKNQGGKL